MSNVCINIADSTVSVIIFGSVAAIVAAIATILNMFCPFISSMVQNKGFFQNNPFLQMAKAQTTQTNQ